jgi:hypothetical protein
MEQVAEKKCKVGNFRNVDCLLKNTTMKHNKYVINQIRKHFDDVSFNELFVGITFVNHKIRFQDICTNIDHSF